MDNAQTPASGGLQNLATVDTIDQLAVVVLTAVVYVGSILLVLAIVWVGFQFVVAQGAEEKLRDARTALFWTVVGGLVLLGAQALSLVLQATVEAL